MKLLLSGQLVVGVLFSGVVGFIDVVSFLGFNGLFIFYIIGNLVIVVMEIIGVGGEVFWVRIVVILVFMFVVFLIIVFVCCY